LKPILSLYLLDLENFKKDRDIENSIDLLSNRLGKEQREKLLRIHDRKKTEFVLSRSLLKFALDRHLKEGIKMPKGYWQIREREQLPPKIENVEAENLQFSISHSQSIVSITCCLSNQRIGFDIQACKQFSNFQQGLETAKYFCNDKQLAVLSEIATDQNMRLFSSTYTLYWSLKEAYFKALHQGIHNESLKNTSFEPCTINKAKCLTRMYQNALQAHFQIAVYHSKPFTIETHQLEIENSLIKISNHFPITNIGWEGFRIRY